MSKFQWIELNREYGSATFVAFVAGGAVIRQNEWEPDSDALNDAVALVFIPGAKRSDFFGDEE